MRDKALGQRGNETEEERKKENKGKAVVFNAKLNLSRLCLFLCRSYRPCRTAWSRVR